MDSFGKRLQATRLGKKISQEELAALMGKSKKQVISRWENDKNEPSLTEIRKLAEILEVTAAYLVDGVEGGSDAIKQKLAETESKLNHANELLVQYQQKELENRTKEIERLKHQ